MSTLLAAALLLAPAALPAPAPAAAPQDLGSLESPGEVADEGVGQSTGDLMPEQVGGTLARTLGAAFGLDHDPALEASETGNGSVHFLELRRAGVDGPEVEPLVKLMLAPGAAAQLDAAGLLALLEQESRAARTALGLDHRGTVDVTADVLGGARAGRRLSFRKADLEEDIELYALQRGDDLVAVQLRRLGDRREDCDRWFAEVLGSLTLLETDADATRTEAFGPFTLQVPLVTPEGRQQNGQVTNLQLGFPEGMLELAHQAFAEDWEATFALSSYASQRRDQVAGLSDDMQAEVGPARWAGLWVREGLLAGEVMTVGLPDGRETDVTTLALAAGPRFLGVTWETAGQFREAMGTRARTVLGTLELPEEPAALDAALGKACLVQDLGLTWLFPAELVARTTLGDPSRIDLASLSSSPPTRTRFFLDVHVAPLPVPTGEGRTALGDELLRLVDEHHTGGEPGEAWQVQAGLFEERRIGLTQTFTVDGEAWHLTAVTAPHRGGELVAGAVYPATDSNPALWAFANLLARVTPLPDGDRTLRSSDWTLGYDPADWVLSTRQGAASHSTSLTRRAGEGWLQVITREQAALGREMTYDGLVALAETVVDSYRSSYGRELGALVASELGTATTVRAVRLGSELAIHTTDLVTTSDGSAGPGRFDTWVLRAPGRQVVLRALTPAGDAAALAAVEGLVARLTLTDPAPFVPRRVHALGLALDLPAGLTPSAYDAPEGAFLELWPGGSGTELMTLELEVPGAARLAERAEQRAADAAFTADLLMGLIAPDAHATSWLEPVDVAFAGETLRLERLEARDAAGAQLATVEQGTARHDGRLHVVTLLTDASRPWVRAAFLEALASARPLPVVDHAGSDLLSADFEAGRLLPAWEGDTLALSGAAGELRLMVAEDGSLMTVGAPALQAEVDAAPTGDLRPETPRGAVLGGVPFDLWVPEDAQGAFSSSVADLTHTPGERDFLVRLGVRDWSTHDVLPLLEDLEAEVRAAAPSDRRTSRRTILGTTSHGLRFRDGSWTYELHAVPVPGHPGKVLTVRGSWATAHGASARGGVDLVLDGLRVTE